MRRVIGWLRDAWDTAEAVLLMGMLQLGDLLCGNDGDEFDP